MMTASKFLSGLRDEVLSHPAVRHRLPRAFAEHQVDRAAVRRFAALYYPHILRTRRYQAAALARCDDEGLQLAMAIILADEYGHGDRLQTHPAIYRRLLRALELPAETPSVPEALAPYIETHFALCGGDQSTAIGCAGLAMEWPIPTLYRAFVTGLRGVGLDEDAIELFTGHMEIDVEHARLVHDAILPLLDTEESRARVRTGALNSMDARARWHDALASAVLA